jgi:hypothetical protein
MELDDLKSLWKHKDEKKLSGEEIRNLLQNRSYGPLARLKNRFRRGMFIIPFAVVFLVMELSKHHDIFNDVLFWLYVVVCIGLVLYFYINYRVMDRAQNMEGPVKSVMERMVHILENGIRIRLLVIRILFVLFIVVFEVLLYFNQEPKMVKWYVQPLYVRLSVYAVLIIVFYLFTGMVIRHKYKTDVLRLKEIVQQME